MDKAQLNILFRNYLDNRCSEDQLQLLMLHFHTANESALAELVKAELQKDVQTADESVPAEIGASLDRVHQRLQPYIGRRPAIIRRIWPRVAIGAASIVAMLTIGYVLLRTPEKPKIAAGQNKQSAIKAGATGAVLTLADGRRIVLEHAGTGLIAQQNGSNPSKTGDSMLIYLPGNTIGNTTANTTASTEITYNTLETPKGRQYAVVLPDGTQVRLNAASTLRYPTRFDGKQRIVELTGEAYFQVVHDPRHPFEVRTAGQVIDDIGTRFDIAAYPDDPAIQTLLLEGGVRVTTMGQQNGTLLKPGQQASSTPGRPLQITEADTAVGTAWLNGNFIFDSEYLGGIMRKISRWYDIEVDYEDRNLPGEKISGTISRYADVDGVLRMLELTGAVHFKITGRKIYVRR